MGRKRERRKVMDFATCDHCEDIAPCVECCGMVCVGCIDAAFGRCIDCGKPLDLEDTSGQA